MVQVHYGEGVAIHIGPEPCAGLREGVGEASVGECIGQPLSREIVVNQGADVVHLTECQRRRENVSAGRSKSASRRGAKCRTGRLLLRDKHNEKRIALPSNVPETSSVASPGVAPVDSIDPPAAPAPLLNPKINATDVGPVELWATRWRRPSAATNPQGFCLAGTNQM